MKFLKAFLPLFFAPFFLGAIVSSGPVFDQNFDFSAEKHSKKRLFEQKLEARLAAILAAENEPSAEEKKADRRAVNAFAFGLLGIGILFMLPNWIAILAVPFLLLAFFNGTAAVRKTYRRGFAITGITIGSLLWVFLFALLISLLLGGF